MKHLPALLQNRAAAPATATATAADTTTAQTDLVQFSIGTTVEEAEKLLVLKTLESTNNNKTRAAEILAISLKTLHNKLKEYGNAATTEALALLCAFVVGVWLLGASRRTRSSGCPALRSRRVYRIPQAPIPSDRGHRIG